MCPNSHPSSRKFGGLGIRRTNFMKLFRQSSNNSGSNNHNSHNPAVSVTVDDNNYDGFNEESSFIKRSRMANKDNKRRATVSLAGDNSLVSTMSAQSALSEDRIVTEPIMPTTVGGADLAAADTIVSNGNIGEDSISKVALQVSQK